jgi:hypothetical protein
MASNGIGDLGQYDFMNKGMYPGSQIDRSYYATPTQVPLGAQAVMADYDPAVNPLTGQPVSRFAQGGIASFAVGGQSVFKDDPNNFVADLTKAYKATLGRDPSTKELRDNVDALNRDPDAYAFIVDQLVDDPSAAKFYAENAKPQVDEEGNQVAAPEYDPNQIAMELKGAYGKFTPTPEVGGIQGFANKIGPYAPFLMAAAAIAGPAIAAELAGEAALSSAAAMGPTYAELGYIPLAEAVGTVGAPIFEPSLGITSIAPEVASSGFPGMSAELAAELGLGGSSSGLSGAGASGDVLANMGIEGAGGMTTKQLMAANMGLKTLAGALGNASGQDGGGTRGPSVPAVQMPNQPTIQPTMLAQPNYGKLYDAQIYNYNTRRAAQGGMMYGNGGGISTLGSYSDGGRLLKGPGDGMSDNIPAQIGDSQPAALADGEFVVPADVVSHLGNGSTDAGAKQLYKMMDKIRQARTGNSKQGKQINPNKFLPKG